MNIGLLDDLPSGGRLVNAQQRSSSKRSLRTTASLLYNNSKGKRQNRGGTDDKNDGMRYKQPDPEVRHREILEQFAMSKQDRYPYNKSHQEVYTLNFLNWAHARDLALAEANEKDNQSRALLEQERDAKRVRQDRARHVTLFAASLKQIDPEYGTRSKARHEMIAHADIKKYFNASESNESQKVRQQYKGFYFELVLGNTALVNFSGSSSSSNSSSCSHNDLVSTSETGICDFCNGVLLVDHVHGTLSCTACGASLAGGEGIGFKETFAERQQSSSRIGMPYARVSHFKEFLTRLEGTERTIIPEEVVLNLLRECQHNRIDPVKQPEKITYRFVRHALRRTKNCHFFENIPQLIARITQRPVHYFSVEQRELLINIFEMIQEPFKKHKGKRKNFLSYAYILYKLCELLGLNEFLPFLPLLKAPENLLATDQIWEKICNDCQFQYIPTRWTNGV